MSSKNQEETELFCMIAWQIWNARNDLYFEKITVSPELCSKRAKDLYSEFKKANEAGNRDNDRRRQAKWVPSDQQMIKINVDAAVNI